MKLALSMWSVHRTVQARDWTVIDFLSHCRDEGVEEVELLDVFWHDVERELPRVIQYASDCGIRIASYAVGNDLVQFDRGERKKELKKVLDGINIARRLGVHIVRVFAGDVKKGLSYEEGRGWIIDGLKKATKVAEEQNIMLCLENHGHFAGKSEQVKDIVEQVNSNAFRLTFDVGNFLLVDENPLEALDALLPYVEHVHVKDFKLQTGGRFRSLTGKVYEGVSVHEGDVNVPVVLERLKNCGYKGAIVLEYEGAGSELEGIQRGYRNFEKIVSRR
ncbi:MAG: sugar phosphate isomerase/epimerase [Novibacillus thermophilus]